MIDLLEEKIIPTVIIITAEILVVTLIMVITQIMVTIIIMKIKTLKQIKRMMTLKLKKKNLNKYFDYKCAFLLPLVLKTINENPETIDPNNPFITYIVSITTILVFIFFTLMNIFFYLLVLYLINNYDVETKFPRFIKIINLYKKTTKLILAMEIAFVIFFLLVLIAMNSILIFGFIK